MELPNTYSPATYLTYLQNQYEVNLYAYREATRTVPTPAGLVWLERYEAINQEPCHNPVVYIHMVLDDTPDTRRYARKLLHDLYAHLFKDPTAEIAVLSGIRQNQVWRSLSRYPYGTLSWFPRSTYHTTLGITDAWEFSVTRDEYLDIIDSIPDLTEDWIVYGKQEEIIEQSPQSHTATVDQRPVWLGKLLQWGLHLFKPR